MSCTSVETPVIMQTPTPTPTALVKTIEDYAKESYPVKGYDPRYSEVIKLLSKNYPLTLPCETELFLKAIINAESNFNNASVYKEPPPLNINSIGFFQLSLSDAKIYGCKFKTEADIQNPILNIECAFKIFTKLSKKYPNESIWEYGGRYFSTLRWNVYPKWATKKQSGFNRIRSYLSKNGCEI